MVGHTDLTRDRYEMDLALADVMPDSWSGHARIAAFEEAEELDDDATEFAVTLANRLGQKKSAPAQRLAAAAVKQTKEKFL